MQEAFRKFSNAVSNAVGSSWMFILALLVVLGWALTGPLAGYSNTWQLIINTGTTIVTFLMVFLIQNTQNRDSRAVHLKLDELLRGVKGARTSLVDLEDLSDDELDRMHREFADLHRHVANEVNSRARREAHEEVDERLPEIETVARREARDEVHQEVEQIGAGRR